MRNGPQLAPQIVAALETYFQQAPARVAYVDGTGVIRWSNSAWAEQGCLLDTSLGQFPLGVPLINCLPPAIRTPERILELAGNIDRVLCGHSPRLELHLRDPDAVDSSVHLIFWRTSSDPPAGIAWLDNVPSRHHWQVQLDEAEDRLRDALRVPALGTWEMDVETGETTWSPRTWEIFGETPQDRKLQESEMLARIHAEDVPKLYAAQKELDAGARVVDSEYRILRADGTVRHIITSGEQGFDPGTGRPVRRGTVFDVTSIREAERNLITVEQHFREFAEELKEIFFAESPDMGHISYLSPAFERVFGVSREAALSNPKIGEQMVVAADLQKFQRHLEEARQADSAIEYRIQRPDGDIRWIAVQTSPKRDAAGRVERVIGIASDITERKALEAQFVQAQKMEAVGKIAGSVAHDFNNLLMVVNGYCEVLLNEEEISDRARNLINEIGRAGDRAAQLTHQLLAFSRNKPVPLSPVDLNHRIRDFEPILRRAAGESVTIEMPKQRQLPLILINPSQIDQVLLNLTINAKEAMPSGGRLLIQTGVMDLWSQTEVRRLGLPLGRYVTLMVSDTGKGIAPAHLDHLFEPFFSTKKSSVASGLGLSTIYAIVKNAGGRIFVESTEGAGTSFLLYFPAHSEAAKLAPEPPAQQAAAPARANAPAGTPLQVLLVEDEPPVRALARAMLMRLGHSVVDAADGEEGTLRFREAGGAIDLIVSDVVMPHRSGPDMIRLFRREGFLTPVLFVSGYQQDPALADLMNSERVSFLTKPFTNKQLEERIGVLMNTPRQAGSTTGGADSGPSA